MPQFDPSVWSPQIVWLAIAFITLYWLMSRKVLPRIEAVLNEREERVASSLKRAEELQRRAEEARLAYEAALEEARTKALAKNREAREQATAAAAARHEELGKKLSQQIAEAEARIEKAKADAIAGLRAMALETTGLACERLLGEPVDTDAVAGSVDAAMKEAR